jgi:spore germination cell wall hydrolase CwlJ-like protein
MINFNTLKYHRWAESLALGVLLAVCIAASVAANPSVQDQDVPVQHPVAVAPAVVEPEVSEHDRRQIQCMARNAYFEARGEGRQGMIAVSNVVMNRASDGRWPSTPCGVIYDRSPRGCQFSWVCNPSRINDMVLYAHALELAEDVYFAQQDDRTGGATFFHARHTSPSWSRRFTRTATIGSHVFYRG